MKLRLCILLLTGLALACSRPHEPMIQGEFFTQTHAPDAPSLKTLFGRWSRLMAPKGSASEPFPKTPESWNNKNNPFMIRLWQNGKSVARVYAPGGNLPGFLQRAERSAWKAFKKKASPLGGRNFFQWSLAYDFKPLNEKTFSGRNRELRDRWGLWGWVLVDGEKSRWIYPSDYLSENWKYRVFYEKVCGRGKRPIECVATWEGKAYTFEVLDYISRFDPPYYHQLERLSPVVPITAVNDQGIQGRLALMREWYLKNMSPTGRMTYLYRPSSNRISKRHNNMIRQWMTTLAMFRLAKYRSDPVLLAAAEKNLLYNIKEYLKREPDKQLAYVYFRKKAKLGSAAFALMSVLESEKVPERDKLIKELTNFILHLHQDDGSFKTFYLPKKRNDNQNFYPGEALLALMTLYESNPEKYQSLLKVVGSSFKYYRDYFRRNSNPAFVPWHTMALYRYYQVSKNPEVAKFIFEMNDFLIEIQNTPASVKTPQPDTMGRFYDPKKRKYGPPHASSTAIYTEGLSDAYRLTKELGDQKRAKKYAYGVHWGLRSLFQLQYTPDNTFFVENLPAVLGALHTTVTNSNIRVDNTQHSTMAFLNFLATPKSGQTLLDEAQASRND